MLARKPATCKLCIRSFSGPTCTVRVVGRGANRPNPVVPLWGSVYFLEQQHSRKPRGCLHASCSSETTFNLHIGGFASAPYRVTYHIPIHHMGHLTCRHTEDRGPTNRFVKLAVCRKIKTKPAFKCHQDCRCRSGNPASSSKDRCLFQTLSRPP